MPRHADKNAAAAWEHSWNHFFLEKTGLFYDFIPAGGIADFPNAEEAHRGYPNVCGWCTGMENSMINAGVVMATICDRFSVTGEPEMRSFADRVFTGMKLCATVHDDPGFVARSVVPEDGRAVYPCSSRDQYTHFVHGLWRYYHSPLSDEPVRAQIRDLIVQVAEYMKKYVTPANDYDFNLVRLAGKKDPGKVCKMWDVEPHEAARLPMIYAVAWELTGDALWRDEYRRYAREAASQSGNLRAAPYGSGFLLQMQCSLEVLLAVETDGEIIADCRRAMQDAAERAAANPMRFYEDLTREDYAASWPGWRSQKLVDHCGVTVAPELVQHQRKVVTGPYASCAMAAVVSMMSAGTLSEFQRRLLIRTLTLPDASRFTSEAIFGFLHAYWMARRLGIDLTI